MTLSKTELKVQKRLSVAFIEADGRNVVLTRRALTSDGAGGQIKGEPVSLPAQRMRLIPQEDGATARTTADGEAATPEYMLMGAHDCNMARFDEFILDGVRYQIVYIDDRKYEVKGEVIRLG